MDEQIQAAMYEATALTRAGRLLEATTLIQRTLGIVPDATLSTASPGRTDAPMDAGVRVVDATPSPPVTPQGGTAAQPLIVGMADTLRRVARVPARAPGSLMHDGRARRPAPHGPRTDPWTGGQWIEASYTNDAGTRAYKLYIPNDYTGQAVPLIIMLHGGTQTPLDFAAGTRMNLVAERDTFLVAYPEQDTSANRARCWNWFQAAHQERGAGEPSLIAGITQHIRRAYHLDARRIYVAGFSAGGAMAAVMAATYPDLYAAVGIHSGIAYGAAHNLPAAVTAMHHGGHGGRPRANQAVEGIPMIVFHGDRDAIVAPNNAERILDNWIQRAAQNTRAGYGPVRGRTSEHGQVPGGHAYTRSRYEDPRGQTLAEKWIIHEAGHAWSGGSPRGSYTDPKGPDAAHAMVRFFHEHPIRGPVG